MPDTPPLESLFVRLYFDRHIKKQLAKDLREHGFDVLLTEVAGMDNPMAIRSTAIPTPAPAAANVA